MNTLGDSSKNQAPEAMIVAIEQAIKSWVDPKTPRAGLAVANAAWNTLLEMGLLVDGALYVGNQG